MKRISSKILSVIICVIMIFTIMPISSLALFEEYKYVSLGDSLSNGYALEGFENPGYKLVVKESYAYLFAKEINASLIPMAYSGLRTAEMRFLLDNNYESDDFTRRRFVENGSFDENGGGVDKMRADMQKAVSEADYVSITMGGNDFTTYFAAQLEAWQAGDPFKFDREGYDKNSKLLQNSEYKELEASLKEMLAMAGKAKDFIDTAIKSLRYTYTGFFECFDATVERIYELNDDVILIVNSLINPVDTGLYLANGFVNLGAVADAFIRHINAYMKEGTPFADRENYIYVDIMGAKVPGTPKNVFDDEFQELVKDGFAVATHPNAEGHIFIKDRMIERINVPYYDVDREDAYYDAVAYVCENGLMDGKEVHKFAPSSIATRGMIATALYRNAGETPVDSSFDFIDVAEGEYYTEAVKWAAENDIISPMTKKIFMPFGGMTRQKLVTLLWKMAGEEESDYSLGGYTDSFLITRSAKTAMAWAVENGIIDTVYGKFLAPTKMATRADLAQALAVFCEMD